MTPQFVTIKSEDVFIFDLPSLVTSMFKYTPVRANVTKNLVEFTANYRSARALPYVSGLKTGISFCSRTRQSYDV